MSIRHPALIVRGDQTVLGEAVSALLRSMFPNAQIELRQGHHGGRHRGVDIELANSDRWLCVLADSRDVETARSMLEGGAWCLSTLSDDGEQFKSAIAALINGTPHYLPISYARLVTTGGTGAEHAHQAGNIPAHTPLTAREREVLTFVARGLSNSEIAAQMGISVHTVRTHLSSMATKIDAHNRLRLVAKARQLGYLEAPGHTD